MSAPRLQRARELAGLSVGQAVAKLGWPREHLVDFETGESEPSAATYAELARLYGVSPVWLQGAKPAIPENVQQLLRGSSICFACRDALTELLGAIHTPDPQPSEFFDEEPTPVSKEPARIALEDTEIPYDVAYDFEGGGG